MYKQENKTKLEKSKNFVYWIKRRIILIIAAIMIGMSNAMYDEDEIINENKYNTEQKENKD